ncbi:MAG: LPS export ABC transporter periplasmic protein LptC [Bacteroidia bacterium]
MVRLYLYILILLAVVSCVNNKTETIKIATEPSKLPVERGINISINYTDSGYIKARVFAPVLERYNNEERFESEMPNGITAYFYDNNGKINSYIKSKYAIRNDRNRTMIARKDVIVVNNKGDTLRTEELIWDEKTDKIYTDKNVNITTPDQLIIGTGLESNSSFTWYRVFNIKGIVKLKQ